MKLNNLGLLIMEQESSPGCWGDACAENSRYITLSNLLKNSTNINLNLFVSAQGVVRYPGPPGIWGANDTSDDQVSPLIAATSLIQPILCKTIISQVESNGYKTGNGKYIHPQSYAQLKRAQGSKFQGLLDWTIVIQALLFKIPIYWNDGTKSFQTTANDYADYLNYINFLAFAKQKRWTLACSIATKIVSANTAMSKVKQYYLPEPNVQWLLDIYQSAITKIWS
jgi:hypothetical protein